MPIFELAGRRPISGEEAADAGYISIRDYAWALRRQHLERLSDKERERFLNREREELLAIAEGSGSGGP